MHKKSSVTKRSKIVNSLPRIATSTANTLTAINFSPKNQGGGGALRYRVSMYFIHYSCDTLCLHLRSSPIGFICGGGEAIMRGVKHVL